MPLDPRIQAAIADAALPNGTTVETAPWWMKAIMAIQDSTGTASGNKVYVNDAALPSTPRELVDIINHEGRHVQQSQDPNLPQGSFWQRVTTPYGQQQNERDAYAFESAQREKAGYNPSPMPAWNDTRPWYSRNRLPFIGKPYPMNPNADISLPPEGAAQERMRLRREAVLRGLRGQ